MIGIAKAANTPYRLERVFKNETYIILQIKLSSANAGAGPNFIFAHDMGSVKNGIDFFTGANLFAPADGLNLNAATTSPPTGVPYDIFWQGELWYASDTPNSQFSIEIGTETSQKN